VHAGIPEGEKVKIAKEPKLEVPLLRPIPSDPMMDVLRQQYDAIKKRQEEEEKSKEQKHA